ncbi:tRNA (guanosine(46)-N7)-methyltransferase TrmB [Terribacillus saccharophilus]|uniref:tRNA (guanosine(46)-N7)-methyltransferase TrmB n=1 Tax=Terribacillus saccharophilus TaxID=361277 RepID=UPI000BA6405C|nr:tRNA (guanosine(46)-N7)-methyltransferase TrmB [Terribacillus saccharophilus]PAF19952.1 tRNA (guanosine(46)-N7)-methyltransferase TrmB [Terribacillus saccharophilus]
MRVRHKPWADDYLKENDHIVVQDPKNFKGKWRELFGNDKPLHVEIGSGKGQFITGMAAQYPEYNFIGIELAKSIIVTAVEKAAEADLPNVRLLNENAADFRELFEEKEVDSIYLNFSDPWPKNKHEKRRLTYKSFLEQYEAVLKDKGEVVFKTDNQKLFEYSLSSFSRYGMVLQEVKLDLHAENDPLNVKTEYEDKFSSRGYRIYRSVATFQ